MQLLNPCNQSNPSLTFSLPEQEAQPLPRQPCVQPGPLKRSSREWSKGHKVHPAVLLPLPPGARVGGWPGAAEAQDTAAQSEGRGQVGCSLPQDTLMCSVQPHQEALDAPPAVPDPTPPSGASQMPTWLLPWRDCAHQVLPPSEAQTLEGHSELPISQMTS